jgi:predicted glycosyltransferase
MKLLIDVNHPAHVHLFKNLAWELEKKGHKVLWAARPRDIIGALLDKYGFEYKMLTSAKPGYINMTKELIERDLKIYKLVKDFKPSVMLGTSVCISHVSRVTKAYSIVFNEDDADVVKAFAALSYPFADTICTPDCLKDNLGEKHIKYSSYHELAYLHPTRFSPNPEVIRKLGINGNDKYFIIRFVDFRADHDIGQSGIGYSTGKRLLDELLSYGKVFITSERRLTPEFEKYRISIPPYEMHDALYYATIFIGDSQTMTAEAAVLGTPAIRCNTFVGKCSTLEELEYRYGLTYGFLPKDKNKVLDKVMELLKKPDLKLEWLEKRQRMLKDKIDLTKWMVNFIENYPESSRKYKQEI